MTELSIHDRVRDLVNKALAEMKPTAEARVLRGLEKRVPTSSIAFMIGFPYCFRQIKNGSWVPLNRHYNVLGSMSCHPTDPEAYGGPGIRFKADPRELDFVWQETSHDTLWLYTDNPVSRRTYFDRLAKVTDAIDRTGTDHLGALQVMWAIIEGMEKEHLAAWPDGAPW
jgi:hypothetical protein